MLIFYQLGEILGELEFLNDGMRMVNNWHYLDRATEELSRFKREVNGVAAPNSLASADALLALLNRFNAQLRQDTNASFSSQDIADILFACDSFTSALEADYRILDVFTITRKGLYDMRLLMSRPEEKFPERIQNQLPDQTLHDIKQAASCLAFDIPTACAFHICRATEALMLRYYETLAGGAWPYPRRDWKNYTDQLRVKGAPQRITSRLDEIREFDRNAYAHPDINVSLEESVFVFELCTGVMYYMASEIDRIINP